MLRKKYISGGFYAEESEPSLSQHLIEINAKDIVKESTCYKDLRNSSFIDLIVPNSFSNFQNKKQYTQHYLIFIKLFLKF